MFLSSSFLTEQGERTTLAATALDHLAATFAARNHHPGEPHQGALASLLDTMQSMADGTAEPHIFLASLDPGLGKSSSVVAFAQALVSGAEYRDVGMIVCVGRLDEAKSLAGEMHAAGIGRHVAVRTSDEGANALSGNEPPAAQVLIVTQQKVEIETRHRPFRDASLFHYQGSARAVRVWDEAWLPGKPITLDRAALGGLFRAAQVLSGAFYAALEDLFVRLKQIPDGELVTVPDWTALSGVTETQLLAALGGSSGGRAEDDRLTASALFFVAGKAVRVRRETYAEDGDGRVVISYQDTLPEDLAPLLVLDASIRVRQTYADAVAHRRVKMLPQAVKDYSPLTVHLWKASGGKSGFGKNGTELVQGMANTIMGRPDEPWLIITHKPGGKTGDVESQLRLLLPPGVSAKVSVRTWGHHAATNEFRDCPNVILGGTLFMPDSHYLALTHLAQDKRPEAHGFAERAAVVKTTHGEHRNLILQAACRGRVRQSSGIRCLPMDLYIIASARSAIPTKGNVEIMFPGAAVKRWVPVLPKLSGKALDAASVLAAFLERGALDAEDAFLSYGSLAMQMPGKDGVAKAMQPVHFNRRIADRDEWRDHIAALGLIEASQSKGGRAAARGLRRAHHGEQTEWQDTLSVAEPA